MPNIKTDFPPPKKAMEFLGRKKIVPTDAWDDLKHGEHAHAFTVAHSIEADIAGDIRDLMLKAQANGEAFGDFKKGLLAEMEKKGWYGGAGHTKDEKDYINWRARIMYETNMRTAYSAARFREQVEVAEMRPIWVYKSKLVGDNRRQDHIAIHNKAFRYDDPFWDTNYPPNGWGCECSVVTESEYSAKRRGVEVLASNEDGNPPALQNKDGTAVDWDKFTPETWKYNVGREALAPNFSKYTNLRDYKMADGKSALSHVVKQYRQDMDQTRLSEGEFNTLARRMSEKDYNPQGIMYQVGNLDADEYEAMNKAGVEDSKIMATDKDLYHGIGDKNSKQKIPADLLDSVYRLLQKPERIYENTEPRSKRFGREFHFVRDTKDGKVIKIVLRKKDRLALRIITMGWIGDKYEQPEYKKIW